jgi:Zn-finger nucleic acid-binding protein
MALSCPRCDTALSSRTIRDAEVQVCTGCNGLFVHRGELNKIAEPTEGDIELSTLDQESFSHEDRYPAATCPECRQAPMDKVEFAIYTGIILDHCTACGGFWLDGQELERINDEVRRLDRQAPQGSEPTMLWFARFIWGLPR